MTEFVYQDPNKVGIITYITITILLLALIGVIIYFLLFRIEPPVIEGQFALNAGKSGVVLYVCGANSNQACIFPITNLSDAENICLRYLNVCRAFMVGTDNTVKFVNPSNFTSDLLNNIYVYQYPIEQS